MMAPVGLDLSSQRSRRSMKKSRTMSKKRERREALVVLFFRFGEVVIGEKRETGKECEDFWGVTELVLQRDPIDQ